jgi:hypothetical protein
MSARGQKRRFDCGPAASGLPQSTDIIRPARLVRLVPIAGHHQVRASVQCKPKQVQTYETTPEPSTRGVVDIT